MSVVSYDTNSANPAPPAEGAPPERVSWGAMLTVLENEQQRHESWAGALAHDLANEKLTPVERDTLQRAIRTHLREAAAFAGAWRAIERMRGSSEILAILRRLDQAERGGDDADEIRYE